MIESHKILKAIRVTEKAANLQKKVSCLLYID